MKKNITHMRLLGFCSLITIFCFYNLVSEAESTDKSRSKSQQKKDDQLIPFSFEDRKLTDIIDFLAHKKNVNIILPQGVNAIKDENRVTFQPTNSDMMTLGEAWNMLYTFLELSNYVMSVQGDFYIIVKNDEKVAQEIFPLYINIAPRNLPKTDQRIRYVYYFSNLKLTDSATAENLAQIFKEMLSPNKFVAFDTRSNAAIIVDRADVISSTMNIVAELDASGFKETIEVIQLFNSNVEDIKKVFDSLRLAISGDKSGPFLRGDPKAELSTYFPSGTVIQTDPRRNLLIVMGRESAVTRIREFVTQHLDSPPESGSSILHVYDLQYLNAQDFAKVLQQIVNREGMTDQSRGAGAGTGPERFFNGVIVASETVTEVAKVESALGTQTIEKAQGVAGSVFSGGNRIVVAARKDDWARIKNLIEQLDKPQQQVIIEVFIVDLSDEDLRILGGDLRNPLACGVDSGKAFLTSNLSSTANVIPPASRTIAADLMQIVSTNNLSGIIPIINQPVVGSTLVSVNDPCSGISALIQLLVSRTHTNVISRPHIVTMNNKLANISLTDIRRDRGEAFTSGGGVPTVPIVDINATIQVQIVPRISSPERLALEVGIDINQFNGPTGANQVTRRVATNANLNTGQVLVLGGLIRQANTDLETQTPILARIPILGWFFKRDSQDNIATNLTVFIAPTIVQPKLRGGLNLYTEDKVKAANRITSATDIDNPRDPVTRFFFNSNNSVDTMVKSYLSQSTNSPGVEELKVVRVRPTPEPEVKTVPENETVSPEVQSAQLKQMLAGEENPISGIPESQ
jgi:general secretion pathway protein D